MKFHSQNIVREKFEIDTTESIDRSKDIYKWGKNNDAPQQLISLLNGSATHKGIIESKVSYVISDGWEVINGGVDKFLENGISDYDLTDVTEGCVLDLMVFGGFSVKLVFNTIGEYAYCEHIDFDLLRKESKEDEWVYCEDWSNSRAEKRSYDIYSSSREKGVYVLVFKTPSKREKKELGVYPKPDYIAALTDIESSKEISHFRLSTIKNNFSLGSIVNNPNGVPESEEEKKAARKWAEKFNNEGEYTGGVVINYSDGKENAITVEQINGNDLDKRYLQTETSIINNVLTGHSITSPMLVGIKTSGQMGGSEEIETSFNIFNQTYISKKQNFINRAFNYILNEVAGIDGKIKLAEAKLPISLQPQPTNQFKKKSVVELFAERGKNIDDLDIIFKEQLENDLDTLEAETFSTSKVNEFFEEIGVLSVTDRRMSILSMLDKGNRVADISKTLDVSIKSVYDDIAALKESQLLNDSLEPTSKGKGVLKVVDIPIDEFEVRYTYEKRDDITGDTIIKTSREFCRDMISLNRAYTREEIDVISGIEGRDVFKDRGGWYHNPKTDRNTPYCRHIWKFILVRKK